MEMTEKIYVEKEHDYAKKSTANAGLALGIVGTALGGLALWNQHNRRGEGYGYGAPIGAAVTSEAMYLERKECEDVINLTRSIYDYRIVDITEKNELERYLSNKIAANEAKDNQVAFDLYKNQRDQFDILKNEIDNLKCHIAVTDAVTPYQNKIIQNQIECCCKESNWKIALEAERRACQGQRIVAYANGTFATQGVAQPTFSTTVTPKTPFNPLCCDYGDGVGFGGCGCGI